MDESQCVEAVRKHGSIRKAAKALGVARSTLQKRYNRAIGADTKDAQVGRPQEGFRVRGDSARDDEIKIVNVGDEVITESDALRKAGLDEKLWEVVKVETNAWQVAGKARRGQGQDGRWMPESLWKQNLWQVKITARRKAPKHVQSGIADLLADLNPPSFARPRRRDRSEYVVELALNDCHFGKLAWAAETGEDDYDLKIARECYANAVGDLLGFVKGLGVSSIVTAVGQDFFQADNWSSQTHSGTCVDSTDDRFQKVFRVGCETVRDMLMAAREVADVEVLWIPGNHDRTTSWYMCEYLDAWFRDDPHVVFDNSPQERKYRLYGDVLLGMIHGHQMKFADLPLVMATEVPDLWAKAKWRAWRCGHYHKKQEVRYTAGDTHNGVSVSVLPSLSATDSWHYDKGYVRLHRAAELYLWHPERGYVGHFSANADDGSRDGAKNAPRRRRRKAG